MSRFINGVSGEIAASVSLLDVYQGKDKPPLPMTFHELAENIKGGRLFPMICQECGLIVAGEEHCEATAVQGQRLCPKCQSDQMTQVCWDNFDEAVEQDYPWRPCDHCGYAFLFDDDIGKLVQPDASKVEPGQMGCPNCKQLT